MVVEAVHVTRASSAQPTLGCALAQSLGDDVRVVELALVEALGAQCTADLLWVSDAAADDVDLLRARHPAAAMLVTVPRQAPPEAVLLLLAHGADLVLRDEGVVLVAAAMAALARRQASRALPATSQYL